ncbi:MAG: YjgN family protein [Mesorhizobium sp.]
MTAIPAADGKDWHPFDRDDSQRTVERFTFTGTAREYFGIWIVNILLTILTLGIYSAWAKVRRQRYFYGNTHLSGASFDYHARPLQILVGRIIVLAVLLVYSLVTNVYPMSIIVLGPLFALAIPYFVMRGLRFAARVTSFRNVRFDFHGGYGGAFLAYVLGGIVTWLSLGLLAPVASRWMWRYLLNNVSYGGRPVTSEPALRALYGQWWLPALVMIVGSLVIGVSVFTMATVFNEAIGGLATGSVDQLLGVILQIIATSIFPAIVLLAIVALVYRAGTRNVAFNATLLDGRHRLRSTIHRGRFAWINITNLVATVLTLGLARPWAAVRLAKFVTAATALELAGTLDDFLGDVQDSGAAVGAEFLDVEGFDVGF